MNNKYKNTITAILLACILTMAIGYSVLQQKLNVSGTSNITSIWDVRITNIESEVNGLAKNITEPTFTNSTASFNAELIIPEDSITYDITVSNLGTLDAYIDEIIYNIEKSDAVVVTHNGIEEGDILKAGEKAILTVKVEYSDQVTSQPIESSSTFTLILNYKQSLSTSVEPPLPSAADILISKLDVSGNGLYKDEYESNRYIYKGKSVKNYITFNDEKAGWRIIAVEADGSLKIIREKVVKNTSFDDFLRRGTYCEAYTGCNAWAAIKNLVGTPSEFINGTQTGTVTRDARTNEYLNGDYYDALSDTAKNQIISHDFFVGGIITRNDDLKTQIADEKKYIWNGNIGLINVSDYIKANTNKQQCGTYSLNNTNKSVCKNTNWIQDVVNTALDRNGYKNIILLNPCQNGDTGINIVYNKGDFSAVVINNTYMGITPVLFLNPDISLEGSGTKTDPYVIKEKTS